MDVLRPKENFAIPSFACASVSVMSPMTIVLSPAAWNAAHDVRPWNGCIFAPSMTASRSPRGTLTFAMPFFTSGLRPVIFAISSASGSWAAALLAMATVTTRVLLLLILTVARDLRDQLRVGLLGRSTPRYGHSEDQQQQHAR